MGLGTGVHGGMSPVGSSGKAGGPGAPGISGMTQIPMLRALYNNPAVQNSPLLSGVIPASPAGYGAALQQAQMQHLIAQMINNAGSANPGSTPPTTIPPTTTPPTSTPPGSQTPSGPDWSQIPQGAPVTASPMFNMPPEMFMGHLQQNNPMFQRFLTNPFKTGMPV